MEHIIYVNGAYQGQMKYGSIFHVWKDQRSLMNICLRVKRCWITAEYGIVNIDLLKAWQKC